MYITESNIVPPTTLSFLVGFVYQKKYRHENKVYFTDELRTCNLLSTIKYLQKIQETHDIASCVILKQAWHLQQQKIGSFRLEKVRNVWRMTRKAPKEKHVERSYQKISEKNSLNIDRASGSGRLRVHILNIFVLNMVCTETEEDRMLSLYNIPRLCQTCMCRIFRDTTKPFTVVCLQCSTVRRLAAWCMIEVLPVICRVSWLDGRWFGG